MNIKICTSIDQSERLLELGLPINTADMCWQNNEFPIGFNDDDAIPAWSLTALLSLLPKLYEFENDPDDGGCQPILCKGWDNNQWHIVYRPSIYITEWYNDPIDAAFEMVVWLLENKMI